MSDLRSVLHGYIMAGNIIFGSESDAYFEGLNELVSDFELELSAPDGFAYNQDEKPVSLYPPFCSPPSAE